MKGDDQRAELLATMLDGGPEAETIEPLLPAVRALRDLFARLDPGPGVVDRLVFEVLERSSARSQLPALELAQSTLAVRDLEAAVRFYRDLLGLRVVEESRSFVRLAAGTGFVAVQWTGNPHQRPQIGDLRLEFRTDDFDGVVKHLRDHGVAVSVTHDRRRGHTAEFADVDGYPLVVRAAARVTAFLGTGESAGKGRAAPPRALRRET